MKGDSYTSSGAPAPTTLPSTVNRRSARRTWRITPRSIRYACTQFFCWDTCRKTRIFCLSFGTRFPQTPIGGSKRSWRRHSEFCAVKGYEEALPVIDEWLSDPHPNVRRAVTEGLRIWTSRPYFRDHPGDAVSRLSRLRGDSSEYVRKSVGNALRDISKKHPDLVAAELETWSLETKEVSQVYRLASKLIERVADRR